MSDEPEGGGVEGQKAGREGEHYDGPRQGFRVGDLVGCDVSGDVFSGRVKTLWKPKPESPLGLRLLVKRDDTGTEQTVSPECAEVLEEAGSTDA